MAITYYTTVEVTCLCHWVFNIRVKGYKKAGEAGFRRDGVNTRACNGPHCTRQVKVEVYTSSEAKAWAVEGGYSETSIHCTIISQEKEHID